MINSLNVLRIEFLKISKAISSLTLKSKSLINLEQGLKEKNIEILVESDTKTCAKEILVTLQLILCHSSSLPLHIICDTFESLLIIINSTEKIASNCEGKHTSIIFIEEIKIEIGEMIKSVCLSILNWEFKQTDDHYTVKKHQEEFIIIKSQEVIIKCLQTGLLKHDIAHIIFEKFFEQATKKDFKLYSDEHESVFSSSETVTRDIMKSNLLIVVDTLLLKMEENFNIIKEMNKRTKDLIYEAQNNNRYYQELLEIYIRIYQIILYKLEFYADFSNIPEFTSGKKVGIYFSNLSEALYCLLSFSSELENKSNDLNSLIYLTFYQICELIVKYPGEILFREELEVLIFRILIRPLSESDSDSPLTLEEAKEKQANEKSDLGSLQTKIKQIVSGEYVLSNISDFVLTKTHFLAKMFMLYDCQPYSENISDILLNLISKIARDQVSISSGEDDVIVCKDNLATYLNYLSLMENLIKALNADPMSDELKTKVKFLKENKFKISMLEKAIINKGRKGVLEAISSLVGEDEEQKAFKLSELLVYSRNIPVESVLELIGDKREIKLLNEYMKRFKPLMFNKNIEQSLRELFTSFRLAGVEAQTVERVLEQFGHFYYDFSQTFTTDNEMVSFANKKEAYDFVYLLIMLHTCHHNPNIVNKTNFKWFLDSTKDLCKESYHLMLEKDLLNIFKNIEEYEFDSPLTRNLRQKLFSLESLPIEIKIRTEVETEPKESLNDTEFINCLFFKSETKLLHRNNNFNVPTSLIDLSKSHLTNMIFKDIKQFLDENIDSPNFVTLFDRVIEICSRYSREDIIEEIIASIYEKVHWTKIYVELTDTELNLSSCLITHLCRWVAKFKSTSPNISTILSFAYENDLIENSEYVKGQISEFIDNIFKTKYKKEEPGYFSMFTSMFAGDKSNKHLFDELKAELRLASSKENISTNLEIDLDLSKLSQEELSNIFDAIVSVSKDGVNIFFPHLIYSIIQNNSDDINKLLLERLPEYIATCLSYKENECISDYELIKLEIFKGYILDMEQNLNKKFNIQLLKTEEIVREIIEEVKIS